MNSAAHTKGTRRSSIAGAVLVTLLLSPIAQAQGSTANDQQPDRAKAAAQPGEPAPAKKSAPPSDGDAPSNETNGATSEAQATFPEPEDEGDPEAQGEYAQVVGEAILEFDAGRWAEARALFLRAHTLRPSARTYRTLGMTSFELREYPRAVTELEQALADARRPLNDEQKSHVESLLSRAKLFVGRYRLQIVPADASLWVDGAPYTKGTSEFLQLGVGNHEIVARAPGHQDLRRPLKVQGGEEVDLSLRLRSTAPPVAVESQSERAPAAATESVEAPPQIRLQEAALDVGCRGSWGGTRWNLHCSVAHGGKEDGRHRRRMRP